MHDPNRTFENRLDALFLPQIEDFNSELVSDNTGDFPGKLWEIKPESGKGYYWYYPIDDLMAVVVCEMEFSSEITSVYEVPDFFCFGQYNKNMVSHFYEDHRPQSNGKILGYAWKRTVYHNHVMRNKPLRTASITLLPEAVQMVSSRFNCDPLALASAISELDGEQYVPGLSEFFDDLFTIHPKKVAARVYYESKVYEAAALLIDWWHQKQNQPNTSIRPVDRTALNITEQYIEQQIGAQISLEDLCHVACMSASKLTTLFKRVEGKTPMEYVRDQRLDHACKLLAFGDMSLQEVASSLAFEHQGSFSEAFKGKYGISPREYRKMHTVDYWPSIKSNESSPDLPSESIRKESIPEVHSPFFLS